MPVTETTGVETLSVAGKFRLIQVLKVSVLGSPYPRNCRSLPLSYALTYSMQQSTS